MTESSANTDRATEICRNINDDRFTDKEKAAAVYIVMNSSIHTRLSNKEMNDIIKWLWHFNYFVWEDDYKNE